MSRLRNSVFAIGLGLVAGCAQHPGRATSADAQSLQQWLDGDLAPYLAEQIGAHPRFKNEPFVMVRLDGQDIRADIDGLTRRVRDQLQDRLLNEPGVRLPWQPQQPPAQHHRRLQQASCTRLLDANYYIGIEITPAGGDRHRVSVRALDVRAGEWVSGFGSSWTGELSADERRALQQRRSDESLRGLRVLPFSSDHPDLAAAYLANNLSCLLRQSDAEDLVIYVETGHTSEPHLQVLLGLIGNNLSRYHEVRITDQRREARFILRGETHQIQPGLFQVWAVLHPRGSGEHLAGMDTAAYVSESRSASRADLRRGPPSGAGTLAPAITAFEVLDSAHGSDACTPAPQANDAANCPRVELSVTDSDAVFVFVHGPRDGVSRLSSASCSQTPRADGWRTPDHSYRFPRSRFGTADWATVYAIAVSGRQLAQRFDELWKTLPDACSGSHGLRADTERTRHWLESLDRLLADNGGQAVWSARRLP